MVVDDAVDADMADFLPPESGGIALLRDADRHGAIHVEDLTGLCAVSLPDAQRGNVARDVDNLAAHQKAVLQALR